jgi:hypothetical protein
MGVTVNVDSVFDFDMGRMNSARFILGARRVGCDTPFMGRRGDVLATHRFCLLLMATGDVATNRANLSKQLQARFEAQSVNKNEKIDLVSRAICCKNLAN